MRDDKPHDQAPVTVNNPSVQSSKDDLTPPARPTGTPGEKREEAGQSSPEAWNPKSRGAGDVRFTSYPQNEAAQNPAAWETASPHGDRTLECADCEWSVSGKSEEEVLGYMRAHARQVHGKSEFTSAELESARRAIHKRAA